MTDFTLVINTLRTGLVSPTIDATCFIWVYISAYTYYATLVHVAWTSIERHLLIFNSQLLNKRWARIYLHYVPIAFIYGYTAIYYIYVVFFYPCKNNFDFSLTYCGNVCYMQLSNPVLYSIEMIVHQVVPTIIILLANTTLILRVIIFKSRLQQVSEWRKYRNMTIQLLGIAFICLIFTTPFSLNPLAALVGLPMPIPYDLYLTVFSYWAYGNVLLFPFIVVFT